MFAKNLSAVLAAAAFAALIAPASATATRHRHHPPVVPQFHDERPPLTVTKRSFLDPGPVGSLGSTSRYMTATTYYSRTADQNFLKSEFGNEVLPAPLEVPGRPQAVLGTIWYGNGVAP
jgi:hypothetical protein